jgi:hypothetical protein
MTKRSIINTLLIIILATIVTSTITPAVISADILGGRRQAQATTTIEKTASASARQQIEEQILNATVRFYIETWVVAPGDSGYTIDSASGHGTLKDGGYLVTHNHFSTPPSGQSHKQDSSAYSIVTLANSEGETLFRAPLSDFKVVWEDPETLVITHKDSDLFERLGFVPAEFQEWSSLPLEAGMEVAQVDWDGETTRVDWTTVQKVSVDEGTPRLVLVDEVMSGASGGGIFWQGYHIANNWSLVQELGAADELINATTKVALNSALVVNGPNQVVAAK